MDQANFRRIEIHANDGVCIQGSFFEAVGTPRGNLVLVQEIFGVNAHIRNVCSEFAHLGYRVLAPHFFDRIEPDLELKYDSEDFDKGRQCVQTIGVDNFLRDVRAAADSLSPQGPVGVVGYCFGGVIAALSATRLGLPAIGYYGSRITQFLHEHPQAPLMLHYGLSDTAIPREHIVRTQVAWPEAHIFTYHTGHGFNRRGHADFHAVSAELALHRSLSFLSEHVHQ
jgi:carboxymethylenebutenolidase